MILPIILPRMLVRCTLWCTRTDLGLLVEVTVHPSGVAVCLGSAVSIRRLKGKVHRVVRCSSLTLLVVFCSVTSLGCSNFWVCSLKITVHPSGLLGFWVLVALILLEFEGEGRQTLLLHSGSSGISGSHLDCLGPFLGCLSDV